MSETNEIIEVTITPIKKLWYNEEYNSGGYSCVTDETSKVEINKYGNFVIKGNTVELTIHNEYNAKLEKAVDKKYGVYYEIKGIYQDMPTDRDKQATYLRTILTKNQVDSIFRAYPEGNIIEMVKNDELDHNKIYGVGIKSLNKIKGKVFENFEFQEAFDFLSEFEIKPPLIIRLVKHFKSAGLLIEKIKESPYLLTEVHGVGFKIADKIALSMGHNPRGKDRIEAAIQFVVEEEANNGHTYIKAENLVKEVSDLIGVEENLIEIKETNSICISNQRVSLKRLYKAEEYIADRIKELNSNSNELKFDVDEFIKKQEKKHKITLTDQQKSLFSNIKSNNITVLSGYGGCGKSQMIALIIDLLEQLKLSYKLLAPTGKASRVLANYTGRDVETIHRAIGLGINKHQEAQVVIEEEFVIVDETSMMDAVLCSNLLSKCTNKNLKMLFIGDPSQIPSVSAGNILHDLISSKGVPVTELNIVFRQSEGGILDIATKIRQGKKFIDNNEWGIIKYGKDCIVAAVPKEKIEDGYQYYYKNFLKEYAPEDITIVTPTNKSQLGTVEINRRIQSIVNPYDAQKNEIEYGFNKVVFREGDYVYNTRNVKEVETIHGGAVDLVNGDMGSILSINEEDKEVTVKFDSATVVFEFTDLKQLIHAWCLSKHRMQGSSSKAIIAIADASHKFQLNANLLYTACTRPEEQLVIISQADTINYTLKRFANLRRNTYLKELLMK